MIRYLTLGSINGPSRSWRNANNVVSTESSMGREHGGFDDEPEPSGYVGLSHGISPITDAPTALSGHPVQASQPGEKREIEQKVESSLAIS